MPRIARAVPMNAAARVAQAEFDAALRYFARREGYSMDYMRHGPTIVRREALEAYRHRRGVRIGQ